MTRVLAVVNQKGGVGKTTTAVNLAACFAAQERATLLVDLDPQANASSAYGFVGQKPQIYDALIGTRALKDIAQPTELAFLQLVPSGRDLYGAEVELVGTDAREQRLAQALFEIASRFEVVLIDCPPSLGLLTLNALVAAHGVLVPLQAEYYALEGLAGLIETIDAVRGSFNPDLALDGIILTMVDPRSNLSRQVQSEVRAHFGETVFRNVIPRNVRLSEAPSHAKPVILYDIHSKGAEAYLRLAEEIATRVLTPRTTAVPAPNHSSGGLK
jgi:chromosome partitioning protein